MGKSRVLFGKVMLVTASDSLKTPMRAYLVGVLLSKCLHSACFVRQLVARARLRANCQVESMRWLRKKLPSRLSNKWLGGCSNMPKRGLVCPL